MRRILPTLNQVKKQGLLPAALLSIILVVVFLTEVMVMLVLNYLPAISAGQLVLLDAFLLIILLFPILYFYFLLPMQKQVTERRQAEHELRDANAFLERIFSLTHILVAYMDTDFNFIQVNRAYAEADQREPKDLIGKNHFDLYPDAENQAIFEQVVQTGESYTVFGKMFTYADHPERGATYWNWSLQPVKTTDKEVEGLVLSLVDVTERKLAEQALLLERKRLFDVLDTLPSMIRLLSLDYQVVFANRSFREKFGESNGRPCYQYHFDRSGPCEFCESFHVLEIGGPHRWDFTSRDGSVIDAHEFPFHDVDGSSLILGMYIDITDRKKAEGEIQRYNQELQALSEAERKQRQMAEILSDTSQALSQSLDLDVILQTLLDRIQHLVPYDRAGVFLYENEHLLVSRQMKCISGEEHTKELRIDVRENPLLQIILTSRKSTWFADLRHQPGWELMLCEEQASSWLGIALIAGDRTIGLCALQKESPGFFTAEHAHMAEAIVSLAAVAIQNAWLFEQVLAGRERLQLLAHRLVEVQENERRYIARELHDEVAQALTTLKVGLRVLERDAQQRDIVVREVAELQCILDSVLDELHRLAMNLRPASLDYLGLVAGLRQLTEAVSDKHRLLIQFEALGIISPLPPEMEIALYRIVQEALTNVVRHAHASRVDVLLEQRQARLILIVEDNGVGFDPGALVESDRLGIFGMRERVEMLGGELHLEASPGSGTTVLVEVPYDPKNTHR